MTVHTRFEVFQALFVAGLLLCVQEVSCGGGADIDEAEDGKSGTLSFSPPDLNDEEAHSPWMPGQLKCDGCKAVSYQLYTAFKKGYDLKKSLKGNLPESDITEIVEDVCNGKKTFESYGVKVIKKVSYLSGPGLKERASGPSVMQGGGKWPARLHDMCDEFLGEIGDVEMYDVFKQKPDERQHLEDFLCYNDAHTLQGVCTKSEGVKRWKDEL
ncbi:marginal zone B- and B1-cell-specific protein-like [Tubulanus polymorphus]|uniref:marginal zone B- and B1-cell-specific protein-like n=1 Tax=Tubulanus polymorphus TaxID=672921 RepID=UPI003DA666C8